MITDHAPTPLSALDQDVVKSVPPGGNWRDLPDDFPSKRVQQIREGKKGGSRSTYYGRLQWDRPSYTISTYFNRPGNGCFIHPSAERLITVREAARLQSFPDTINFAGPLRSRCMQVGNAVPPLLSYQIARGLSRGYLVDLFCGAGGMSLGFEWAGFELVAAVDNSVDALRTVSGMERKTDPAIRADLSDDSQILMLRDAIVARTKGDDLILVGGPPCQGFSTAGNNDRADPRNALMWSFLHLVSELRPQTLLFENVPAIHWKSNKASLTSLLLELGKLGYSCATAILHTEGYGVPQLRRRFFIVASRTNDSIAWPQPTHKIVEPHFGRLQPGFGSGSLEVRTVREAIADLPEPSGTGRIAYSMVPRSDYQSWMRVGGPPSFPELISPAAINAQALPQQLQLLTTT